MDAVSIREAKYKTQSILGVINDTIEVGIAKIKGEESAALEVAIIKATRQDEVVPKEKHVATLLEAYHRNAHGVTADIIILGLYKRLEENTKAWLVTLKTLIVFHRLMREAKPSFQVELLRHGDGTGSAPFLSLESFADQTTKDTLDYSLWIRVYSAYLSDRLVTLRVTHFDPVLIKVVEEEEANFKSMTITELLEYVSCLQRLLGRLTDCIPEGAAQSNDITILACSLALQELDPLYSATKAAVQALLGRIFLTDKADADQGAELVQAHQVLLSKLHRLLAIGTIPGLQGIVKLATVEPLSDETVSKVVEYAKNATKDPPKPTANLLGFQSFLVTPESVSAAGACAPASAALAAAAAEPAADAEPFDPFAPPPSPPKPPADPLDKVMHQVFGGALEALELAVKQDVTGEKVIESPGSAAAPPTPTAAAPALPSESPTEGTSPAATASPVPAPAAASTDSAYATAAVEPQLPVPEVTASPPPAASPAAVAASPAAAAASPAAAVALPAAASTAQPYQLHPKDPLDFISTELFGDRAIPPPVPMRLSTPGVGKIDITETTEPAADEAAVPAPPAETAADKV